MDSELPTGRSVEEFAEDVGMSSVARSLLEEVADDPAKIDERPSVRRATEFVEGRLRDHGVGFGAHAPVATYRSIDRRRVFSDVYSVLPCEALQHPCGFSVSYVVDQPQKRRAGRDRRGAR